MLFFGLVKVASREAIEAGGAGFSLDADCTFYSNVFIDISNFLECKLEVMANDESELGTFPFPRSIQALATSRGEISGLLRQKCFNCCESGSHQWVYKLDQKMYEK